MQVDSINKTNFKAQILKSKALTSALMLAQNEAKSGTKEGLKKAELFYNSIRTMEKDRRAETFYIDANPVKLYPYMRLGKNTRLLEYYGNSENDIARSVMDGINKLVEGKYLRDQMSDEAKNVDLTKAFERWM